MRQVLCLIICFSLSFSGIANANPGDVDKSIEAYVEGSISAEKMAEAFSQAGSPEEFFQYLEKTINAILSSEQLTDGNRMYLLTQLRPEVLKIIETKNMKVTGDGAGIGGIVGAIGAVAVTSWFSPDQGGGDHITAVFVGVMDMFKYGFLMLVGGASGAIVGGAATDVVVNYLNRKPKYDVELANGKISDACDLFLKGFGPPGS